MVLDPESYQALIFGGSGISGWAITRAAVLSKSPYVFDKVIALTNRPLTVKASGLPDDSKLELRSGLDLTLGVDAVVEVLRAIPGIERTTHVYFTGECHYKIFTAWSSLLSRDT